MIINKKELIEAANNVSESLTRYVKSTAKLTADLISTKLKNERQKQAAEQRQIQQEQQAAYLNGVSLQLQYELHCVFCRCTPPNKLHKIVYLADLIPAGWKIANNSIQYLFRWNKLDTQPLSRAYQHILDRNLNAILFAFRQRLIVEIEFFQNWNAQQVFPNILHGLKIEQIIDDVSDVVLVIKLY